MVVTSFLLNDDESDGVVGEGDRKKVGSVAVGGFDVDDVVGAVVESTWGKTATRKDSSTPMARSTGKTFKNAAARSARASTTARSCLSKRTPSTAPTPAPEPPPPAGRHTSPSSRTNPRGPGPPTKTWAPARSALRRRYTRGATEHPHRCPLPPRKRRGAPLGVHVGPLAVPISDPPGGVLLPPFLDRDAPPHKNPPDRRPPVLFPKRKKCKIKRRRSSRQDGSLHRPHPATYNPLYQLARPRPPHPVPRPCAFPVHNLCITRDLCTICAQATPPLSA
ncbi:hypothetical protein ES703_113406 [subsurface metagenome]